MLVETSGPFLMPVQSPDSGTHTFFIGVKGKNKFSLAFGHLFAA